MTKFSVIIPYFKRDFYLFHCIDSLLNQSFRDFEIIIVGEKQSIHFEENAKPDIEIRFIEFKDYKKPSEMLNLAVKHAKGEYLLFWQTDFTMFPNHLHKLNFYTETYGKNNLYVGRVLDTRHLEVLEYRSRFLMPYYHYADRLDGCIHKSQFIPFFEGFTGIGSHFYVEWLARMWQKVTFLCFTDLEVIHIPHRTPFTERGLQAVMSNKLYEKCRGLNFNYSRYNELQKEIDDLYEIVKNVKLEGYEVNGYMPRVENV